jgi:hypothetical protein
VAYSLFDDLSDRRSRGPTRAIPVQSGAIPDEFASEIAAK